MKAPVSEKPHVVYAISKLSDGRNRRNPERGTYRLLAMDDLEFEIATQLKFVFISIKPPARLVCSKTGIVEFL